MDMFVLSVNLLSARAAKNKNYCPVCGRLAQKEGQDLAFSLAKAIRVAGENPFEGFVVMHKSCAGNAQAGTKTILTAEAAAAWKAAAEKAASLRPSKGKEEGSPSPSPSPSPARRGRGKRNGKAQDVAPSTVTVPEPAPTAQDMGGFPSPWGWVGHAPKEVTMGETERKTAERLLPLHPGLPKAPKAESTKAPKAPPSSVAAALASALAAEAAAAAERASALAALARTL